MGALKPPHGPQLLLLSRDTHIHPGLPTLHGQDHEVPPGRPHSEPPDTKHRGWVLSCLEARSGNTLSHSPSWRCCRWLSSPTKVSFLGSDLASRCFLIPFTLPGSLPAACADQRGLCALARRAHSPQVHKQGVAPELPSPGIYEARPCQPHGGQPGPLGCCHPSEASAFPTSPKGPMETSLGQPDSS